MLGLLVVFVSIIYFLVVWWDVFVVDCFGWFDSISIELYLIWYILCMFKIYDNLILMKNYIVKFDIWRFMLFFWEGVFCVLEI